MESILASALRLSGSATRHTIQTSQPGNSNLARFTNKTLPISSSLSESVSLTEKENVLKYKQICHKAWHMVEGVLCTFGIFWIVGASSLVCTLLRQPHQAFPSFASQLCQCLPSISSVSIFLSKCGVEGPDVNCSEYITVRY